LFLRNWREVKRLKENCAAKGIELDVLYNWKSTILQFHALQFRQRWSFSQKVSSFLITSILGKSYRNSLTMELCHHCRNTILALAH
jgi:hypothetical protein